MDMLDLPQMRKIQFAYACNSDFCFSALDRPNAGARAVTIRLMFAVSAVYFSPPLREWCQMGYKYHSKKSNAGISIGLRISEQAIQEMIGQLLAVSKPKAVAIHIPLLSTSTRYYDLALFPQMRSNGET
jgi:hypothetical protein